MKNHWEGGVGRNMENEAVHYDAAEFGKRIKDIRKKNKMTQGKLAEVLFISEDSVSNFETGKTMCVPEHITKMCQIFNISADYFYFGKEYSLQDDEHVKHICQRLKECEPYELLKIEQIIEIILDKPTV